MMDLARMRDEYSSTGLRRDDLHPDPLVQFGQWLGVAVEADLPEPNAMVLATVDADGRPWTRYVLLKAATADGFDFYTNYSSNKSTEMGLNGQASVTFGWLDLRRQVNVTGTVTRVPAGESDDYWSMRPRGSQLGAWASDQSSPAADRAEVEARYAEAEARFADTDSVPRPDHWGGWRLVPHTIEFWQGRLNRLHDRFRYQLDQSGHWTITRLHP